LLPHFADLGGGPMTRPRSADFYACRSIKEASSSWGRSQTRDGGPNAADGCELTSGTRIAQTPAGSLNADPISSPIGSRLVEAYVEGRERLDRALHTDLETQEFPPGMQVLPEDMGAAPTHVKAAAESTSRRDTILVKPDTSR